MQQGFINGASTGDDGGHPSMTEVIFYMEKAIFGHFSETKRGCQKLGKKRNVIYEQPQEENLYENRTGAHHYCIKVVFGKLQRFFQCTYCAMK